MVWEERWRVSGRRMANRERSCFRKGKWNLRFEKVRGANFYSGKGVGAGDNLSLSPSADVVRVRLKETHTRKPHSVLRFLLVVSLWWSPSQIPRAPSVFHVPLTFIVCWKTIFQFSPFIIYIFLIGHKFHFLHLISIFVKLKRHFCYLYLSLRNTQLFLRRYSNLLNLKKYILLIIIILPKK